MPNKLYVSAYSGPCKARNAQKIICFCIFRALQGPECPKNDMFLYIPGLARPGMPKKIICFCIFRALQGPECPKNGMFLYIPGLARPGMPNKWYVSADFRIVGFYNNNNKYIYIY